MATAKLGELIELPLFDLQYNKNIKKIKHYIELRENHLLFVIECYMDVHPKPDDDLPTIKFEEYCNQVDRIRKADIYWLMTKFQPTMECWSVEWFFGNENTYTNFETEKEARDFEKKLFDWLGWE